MGQASSTASAAFLRALDLSIHLLTASTSFSPSFLTRSKSSAILLMDAYVAMSLAPIPPIMLAMTVTAVAAQAARSPVVSSRGRR